MAEFEVRSLLLYNERRSETESEVKLFHFAS